ncbi:hypothetical protein MPSEU_000733100 [Mayamaea pseudoterrestris]|nr:hypothetical protein MPSEU_000733100 [Mayamaea pseudoterrestris]
MVNVPLRLGNKTLRRQSLETLAYLLTFLLISSCVVNISFLERHLSVEEARHAQESSPLSAVQSRQGLIRKGSFETISAANPIVDVDDGFTAEDASYSVSESEDEEEGDDDEEDEDVEEEEAKNEVHALLEAENATTKEIAAKIGQAEEGDAVVDDDGNIARNDDGEHSYDDGIGSVEFRLVDLLGSNLTTLINKRQVFSLLIDAGIESMDLETIRQLPNWKQIESLYYPSKRRPVILGLETCEEYRHTVSTEDRYLATAGLFNTGTNALSYLLRQNILMEKKAQWQVPWSKHRLLRISANHTAPNMQNFHRGHVLPIVIIKDMYTWLQSMCNSPYEARWKHGEGHCPNLVPNKYDLNHFPALRGRQSVPVKVRFSGNLTMYWDSLVALYNEWYRDYYDAAFPRLIVRFEDLLFAPEELLQAIADCVGADLAPSIHFNTESAKEHGSQTNLVGAIIKIGTGQGRFKNMTEDDLMYIDEEMNEQLRIDFEYTKSNVQLPLKADVFAKSQ